MKRFPINYGGKVVLRSCKVETTSVLQGDHVKFSVQWEILKRMPLFTKICYYITDGISETIVFEDTEKSKSRDLYYSQLEVGEIFEDEISIMIPSKAKIGHCEINAFLYPSNGFKSGDGENSSVWPEQKIVGEFDIKWQKDLNKKFLNYNDSRRDNFFKSLISLWSNSDSLERNPNIYMWAEFAFSTNSRGANVMKILEKYTPIEGKKYLDVGCAYCGFLVAAYLLGAKKVEGIDINQNLIDLGKANLKDYAVKANVKVADILDKRYVASKGFFFDIITCNDVIEHVLDPGLAIRNISSMLSPDGVVMFEIPNMNNPQFVKSDGHFSMFAITLLDRDDAISYYHDSEGKDYSSVGFYHTLETYKKMFKKNGLKFIIDSSTIDGLSKAEIESDVAYLRDNLSNLLSHVHEKHYACVKNKMEIYIRTFDKDLKRMSEEDFLLKYGPGFWTIIGKKN